MEPQITGVNIILRYAEKLDQKTTNHLLNSSVNNTNFIYSITGVNNEIAKEVNKVKKFNNKFEVLRKNNAAVSFVTTASNVLKNNLIYIDSCLPEIIGALLLLYYSSSHSTVAAITDVIKQHNPLNFDYTYNQDFYVHKVKRMLTDIALGLNVTKPWTGKYDATGGYIIVKKDGDVVCYHSYDKNQFEDYLFYNTRLETPSTTRHQFGDIYEEDGRFFMKLNLQIRFI